MVNKLVTWMRKVEESTGTVRCPHRTKADTEEDMMAQSLGRLRTAQDRLKAEAPDLYHQLDQVGFTCGNRPPM